MVSQGENGTTGGERRRQWRGERKCYVRGAAGGTRGAGGAGGTEGAEGTGGAE